MGGELFYEMIAVNPEHIVEVDILVAFTPDGAGALKRSQALSWHTPSSERQIIQSGLRIFKNGSRAF